MGYKELHQEMTRELREAGCTDEYIKAILGPAPKKEPPAEGTYAWIMKKRFPDGN